MIHFTKILCPYDFSEFSEEAIRYAIKISDKDTLITMFNVVQVPYIMDPNGMAYYEVKAEDVQKSAEDALNAKMNELKKTFPNCSFNAECVINNDPTESVLEKQKEGKYELIVMGSHGRRGFGRILLGSVSESVLREANCPVLIVKMKSEINKK